MDVPGAESGAGLRVINKTNNLCACAWAYILTGKQTINNFKCHQENEKSDMDVHTLDRGWDSLTHSLTHFLTYLFIPSS